jgi:hypothetical protein
MTLYKSSNTPGRRLLRQLAYALRWLLAGPPEPSARPVPVPPAPDCVAPAAGVIVGADLAMTPQALEELWRAHPAPPRPGWVRPAVPPAGDEQGERP